MVNRVIIHSGISAAEADRIFKTMVELTSELFGMDPGEIVCSNGKIKRWTDLADAWKNHFEDACEYSIFEMAIHKLYWGVYPKPMLQDYIPLVQLVEDELLSDGPAYKAWKNHVSYRFAFLCIREQEKALVNRGPRPHSQVFASYQNSRFWFNVVYKRRKPGLIDPAASLHDIKAAKTHESIYAVYDGFEKAVNCLIPDSKDWSDAQWLDDLNIRRCLKKLYNVSYADYDRDFEILIAGLMNKLHYNSPVYLAQLLELGTIPNGMVQRIWPVDTDTVLKKLFLQAASRAQNAETRIRNGISYRYGLHSYNKLKNSWLYKYVYNDVAYKASADSFGRKVKKKLLEVSARI